MKLRTSDIKARKGGERITCLTAGDSLMARYLDMCGVDVVLVGDSLGMTLLGYESTLPVTLDAMLHHTAAVVRGVASALVVADMPFMSYQADEDDAVYNAGRFLKESGADAVKIEGGEIRASLVKRLTANGIPVLGHIGLTPQSVNELGGYRVQGREPEAWERLVHDANALEVAGAFGVVLECVPPDVADLITQSIKVPTIGIGAGAACDGQVLVLTDLLGLSSERPASFVKTYANLGDDVCNAIKAFCDDVRASRYPDTEHCYKQAGVGDYSPES